MDWQIDHIVDIARSEFREEM